MLERVLLLVLRFLIRIFFRAVEINGAENVPLDRGGVLVAWHPNALVDPCLLFATFPGQVAFGARHLVTADDAAAVSVCLLAPAALATAWLPG